MGGDIAFDFPYHLAMTSWANMINAGYDGVAYTI